jgi:hypothetical protein
MRNLTLTIHFVTFLSFVSATKYENTSNNQQQSVWYSESEGT